MSTGPADFGRRLASVFSERGHYCVGVDPHPSILADWGLPDSAAGAEGLGTAVVAAAAGTVGIVKPQVALFERFGSVGYRALERVIGEARDAGLLVIADAKRGDIGSSLDGYARAWLGSGSPLESDAVTLNPYLGVGALAGAVAEAELGGKGVFVLAATSNPEAARIQRSRLDDMRTLARGIIEDVSALNAAHSDRSLGTVGIVLGATLDLAAYGIDTAATRALPVLAPGFGHQGADVADAPRLFGSLTAGLIVSESRSVLAAGPRRIREAIADRARRVGIALG